jgi:molybdate transport system permease protein
VQALDYGAANRLAIALLLISFAVLSTVYAVNRQVWSPWSLAGSERARGE